MGVWLSHDYTNDVNGRASKERRWQCASREALVLVLDPGSREALVPVLNLPGNVR